MRFPFQRMASVRGALTAIVVAAAPTHLPAQIVTVPVGGEVEIDAHGVCRVIGNGGSVDIMVPTRAAEEWSLSQSSFLQNIRAIPGITAKACIREPRGIWTRLNCILGAGTNPSQPWSCNGGTVTPPSTFYTITSTGYTFSEADGTCGPIGTGKQYRLEYMIGPQGYQGPGSSGYTFFAVNACMDETAADFHDHFMLGAATNAARNTYISAPPVTVSGLPPEGGEISHGPHMGQTTTTQSRYRINGGAWANYVSTALPGVIHNGDVVEFQVLSASGANQMRLAFLSLGGVSREFMVTTN